MGGRAVHFLGGRYFPPKYQNTIHTQNTNDIAPTMAAAAALLWEPSDGFAPTIVYPETALNTNFQDIPLGYFCYAWFSAGGRQPVVPINACMPTVIDATIHW